MKIIKVILITIAIAVVLGIAGFFYFINEFAKGFGGNIGTITCVDDNKLKDEYLMQYVDSFYVSYPQYQVPDSIKQNNSFQSLDYDHLSLSKFYFSTEPIEVYYIQWSGPGCVNIRFTYDPKSESSSGVFRGDSDDKIKETEIERIKSRFEREVIPKLEETILRFEPKDSIYLNY